MEAVFGMHCAQAQSQNTLPPIHYIYIALVSHNLLLLNWKWNYTWRKHNSWVPDVARVSLEIFYLNSVSAFICMCLFVLDFVNSRIVTDVPLTIPQLCCNLKIFILRNFWKTDDATHVDWRNFQINLRIIFLIPCIPYVLNEYQHLIIAIRFMETQMRALGVTFEIPLYNLRKLS